MRHVRPPPSAQSQSRASRSRCLSAAVAARPGCSLMASGSLRGGQVHPGVPIKAGRAARYKPKPKPPLASLDGAAKAARAAAEIQAHWRGRMTRDELYWEMMGFAARNWNRGLWCRL